MWIRQLATPEVIHEREGVLLWTEGPTQVGHGLVFTVHGRIDSEGVARPSPQSGVTLFHPDGDPRLTVIVTSSAGAELDHPVHSYGHALTPTLRWTFYSDREARELDTARSITLSLDVAPLDLRITRHLAIPNSS